MKEKLKQLLSQRQKSRVDLPGRAPAAVLVPLFIKDGEYHVVLIRRSDTVKVHKGQISFPGGNREEGDPSLLDTALRESAEEIGLREGDAEILGELDDEITTTSNYIVSPFLAMIPWPYEFHPSSDEVAEIIEVPIAALLGRHSHQTSSLPEGRQFDSYAYHYRGKLIWGATARILKRFLDIFAQAQTDGQQENGTEADKS